jgi:hypothetical protein
MPLIVVRLRGQKKIAPPPGFEQRLIPGRAATYLSTSNAAIVARLGLTLWSIHGISSRA